MRACYTLVGHFGGLFSCWARRWGRKDVGVLLCLTGGAVVLGACYLFLWCDLVVVVVGGAGVLLERSVCLGVVVYVCFFFPICVLGEGVEAGVCTIWCWVIFLFFVVLAVVGRGVSRFYFLFLGGAVSMLRMLRVRWFCLHRRSVGVTLCESLG